MPDNYVSKFNINDKELIVKDSEARNTANTASTNATNALNRITEYKELLLYKTNELNKRISTIIADGQQTEGNTELIDIRTGADGKVYPTAGDAVRVQIGALSKGNAELKEDLDNIDKSVKEISDVCYTEDNDWPLMKGYISEDGTFIITNQSDKDYGRYLPIKVYSGTHIKVLNDDTNLIFATYSDENTLIKRVIQKGIGTVYVDNECYIRYSIYDKNNKSYTDQYDALNNVELHLKVKSRADDIEKTIKSIEEDVKNLDDNQNILNSKKKLVNWCYGELHNNGAINTNNTGLRFKVIQLLRVGEIISIPSPYIFNIAKFSPSKSFISYLGIKPNGYVIEEEGYYMVSAWKDGTPILDIADTKLFSIYSDVTELRTEFYYNKLANTSVYNRTNKISFGYVPNVRYYGKCESYDSSIFNSTTQYNTVISKFDELVENNQDYVTKRDLGLCSDDTNHIYEYDFLPKEVSYGVKSKKYPKIMIVAGQQGVEKASTYGLYYFLKDLCENWNENEVLAYMRNHINIKIIPICNPYSFNINSYYNKNGVNINRNYNTKGFFVAEPFTPQCGGNEPFDQIETRAIRDFVYRNNDSFLLIDFHTFGSSEHTNYEFNWLDIPSRDDDYFLKILTACENHLINLTNQFISEYNLPSDVVCGKMTYQDDFPEGSNNVDHWCLDQNIMALTCEGFSGIPNRGTFTSEVLKANSEIIGNLVNTILLEYSLIS